MTGTNMRIIRVENGWRLIIGDWQLDTDGAKPTEKVAISVAQLVAIVGSWAELDEPPKSTRITGLNQLRSQAGPSDQLNMHSEVNNGPIRPPVDPEEAAEHWRREADSGRFDLPARDTHPTAEEIAECKAKATAEPVEPPANESHGFQA